MPAFRYKHGDRPLDGYMIQRGVGRGGFGEVYYAVSDSGREVALKVIQGYEQIELRGVSQCMNLKSPHLVTIFDVRHNVDGIPFVIMEYVGGPSLRELCDQQPAGLGVQKAAFFLREIGKGLTFLHDCGIVHRDLKPGNIFYENGYVKIGDYGLSKAMSASQHSGQTMTVGTVHYMAPEIGLGRYDRSIDIYAMGAVLFEMITGQVPYLGASAGEILMKHMSSEPNVQGIEEPFATVIKKAMARDPALRYQTVQEMVEAVFGADHVRESVSGFSPGDLSMVAQRVAARVTVGVGGSSGPPMPPAPPPAPDSWQNAAFAERPNRVAGLATPPPLPMPELPSPVVPARPATTQIRPDPIPSRQRYILAGATTLVIALAGGAVSPANQRDSFFPWMVFSLFCIAGALGGMVIGRRWLLPKVAPDAGFVARLSVGAPAALLGLIAALPAFGMADGRAGELLGYTWLGLILPIVILNWVKWTAPHRVTRVSLVNALVASAFALAMTSVSGGSRELGIAILAGITLAAGVLFPWTPRMFVPAATSGAASPVPAGLLHPQPEARPLQTHQAPAPRPAPARSFNVLRTREVSDWVRWAWRGGMALAIPSGVVLITAAESFNIRWNPQERSLARGFGVGLIILGVLCLFQSLRRRMSGWWSYLIKPLVLFACLQLILIAAFQLGSGALRSEESLLATFFIIFPAICFLTLLFVQSRSSWAPTQPGYLHAKTPPPLPPPSQAAPSADYQAMPQQPSAPFMSAPAASLRRNHPRPEKLRILCNLIGWAIHTVTFFIAIAVAVHLPAFIAAGLVDPRLPRDLSRALGNNWPRLLHLLGYILTYIGAFLATLFLMLGRRSQGIVHMIRPIFAAACFLIAMVMLDHSLIGAWTAVPNATAPQIGNSIVQYLEAGQAKGSIMSLMFALAGLALLLWPAPHMKFPGIDREDGVA
jgi:hypothetical protein